MIKYSMILESKMLLTRYFIFVLLPFICKGGYADTLSYIGYHNTINKAELYICRYEFDSAQVVYETVFVNYPNHFHKDLRNACLCYIKTSKLDKAELLAEELVLHGYELNDFEKDTVFTPLIRSQHWKTFINSYTRLRNKYTETLDPNFRNKIYEMFLKDQSVALSKKICFQDSIFYYQAVELEKVFSHYGFPGCMINKDTLNTKMHILIRHYFGLVNRAKSNPEMLKESCYRSMDFNRINLKQIIDNGLYKGLILPQTYVGMISHWDNSNPYGDLCVKVDFNQEKTTLFLNLPPEKIIDVNKNRVAIGLPKITFTNPDVLNTTWYSEYPFAEIKKMLLACEACTTETKYINLIVNEEIKASDHFKANPRLKGFILPELSGINCKFLDGIKKYFKNAKSVE
ncbi:MAG: hypothetical protein HXX16_18185 [Bacteroidales bacterium]|nr:hypothetical protein [Bacteroidales bacterium]